MRSWYLIQTKPRRERTALEHLQRQGYEIYLPLMRVRRRLRGRYSAVVEPMFPGYVFACLDDRHDDWGPIRSTVGVSRLVRFGGEPARVPATLVEALRGREDRDGVQQLPEPRLERGDRVRIVDGAMAGLEAIFEARSGSERVVLLLQLAEHAVRVDLSADSVEPA